MLSTYYGFAMEKAVNQVKSYAKATVAQVGDAINLLLEKAE